MEVKRYNTFVVIKPKPKPRVKPKTKPKPQTKFEARGIALENKKKFDIIYAKGFVKTSRKLFRAMGLHMCFTITMTIRNCFADNKDHDNN